MRRPPWASIASSAASRMIRPTSSVCSTGEPNGSRASTLTMSPSSTGKKLKGTRPLATDPIVMTSSASAPATVR